MTLVTTNSTNKMSNSKRCLKYLLMGYTLIKKARDLHNSSWEDTNMEQQLLNVNDIAKITGVHAQTIRNWEKAKLLHPLRLNGGQRVYTSEHLEVVKKIKMLRDQGMQNKAIKTALEGGIKVTNISDFKSKKTSSEKETVSPAKETSAKSTSPEKKTSTSKKTTSASKKTVSQKKTQKKAAMSVETLEKPAPKKAQAKASSKPSQRPSASTSVKKDSPKTSASAKKTVKKETVTVEALVAKYDSMGIEDLQAEAKKQGVRQFRRMLKEELVLALADPNQREYIISKVRDRARERYGKHGSRIGATTVERVQSVVSTSPKKATPVKKKETAPTKKSTATAAVPSTPVIRRSEKEEAIAYLKQEAASRQISLEDLVKELKASK